MDFLDILAEKAFLGREFLTWLWFRSEQSGGRIEISGNKTIEVHFMDQMKLDLSGSDTPQTVMVKGEQSRMREGIAALREGKKIEETRVLIKPSENEFAMVVKGTWLSFGSLRTPPILPQGEMAEEEGVEVAFLEKVSLIEEAMEAVDDLFRYFLGLRISEEWEKTHLPAMRSWIAEPRDT
ncbi:MAG: hypothetical protein AB1646_26405 [Thermodesulfobacteriota bacterium]